MAKLGKPAVAIAIMAVIIATLLMLVTPRTVSRHSAVDSATTRSTAPKP